MKRTVPPDDQRPARLSPEERSYFQGIEAHFIRRRGRPLILSPRELKRAAAWHGEGIPLAVVCRGIDRYFERKTGQRTRERAVSLEYCEPHVREAFDEHCRLAVGGPTGGGVEAADVLQQGLSRLRERLEEALRRQTGAASRRLEDLLRRSLSEVQGLVDLGGATDVERAEAALAPLNRHLAEELLHLAGDQDLDALRRSCRAELRENAPEMAPERIDETLQRMVVKRIRKRFGVPELTLFSL